MSHFAVCVKMAVMTDVSAVITVLGRSDAYASLV